MSRDPKGNHEPRSKRDPGGEGVMCPNWVRGELAKLANQLDGRYAAEGDTVFVAAAALMGPNGFDVRSTEEATTLEFNTYGPAMLEGYSAIAAMGLAKVFDTIHASLHHPNHEVLEIEDDEERIAAMRTWYERAMRRFLQSVITYAGGKFQEGKAPDLSVAAGSQMLNMWLEVARRTIIFQTRKQEGDDDDPGPEANQPGR